MSSIGMQTKKLLGSAFGIIVRKASRNYIAGPAPADAQRISRYLVKQGYWVSQGYWDGGGEAPEQVRDLYLATLEQLAEFGEGNYLSLKIPALDYSPELYEAVLAKSHRSGVPLHFDSLAPEHAGRTHTFIREHNDCSFQNTGCTLPGRWQRSIEDADMVSDLGLNARVVKGQWEDPDNPGIDARLGYLKVIDQLAGKARCVRVATHDLPLARNALTRLKTAGTKSELELLYGLPHITSLVTLAAEMAVPVRIYIAFGHAYLPYALSSLGKDPRMGLKLLKEAFKVDYLSTFPTFSNT